MIFDTLAEFDKDFKRLLKKYRTLERDIASVKKVLEIRPDARHSFSFQIDGLGISTCIIKIKKISSDSFKGCGVNSGFRLIYAYFESEQRIVFIELYHKNERANEDRHRILKYFS
jgi:mRNA-degrading endonuclease YafQ of YafQ-DinJ toxin-antitoxin module